MIIVAEVAMFALVCAGKWRRLTKGSHTDDMLLCYMTLLLSLLNYSSILGGWDAGSFLFLFIKNWHGTKHILLLELREIWLLKP